MKIDSKRLLIAVLGFALMMGCTSKSVSPPSDASGTEPRMRLSDSSIKAQVHILNNEAWAQLVQTEGGQVTLNGQVLKSKQLAQSGDAVVNNVVCDFKSSELSQSLEPVTQALDFKYQSEEIVRGKADFRQVQFQLLGEGKVVTVQCMRASRIDEPIYWSEIEKSLGASFKIEYK